MTIKSTSFDRIRLQSREVIHIIIPNKSCNEAMPGLQLAQTACTKPTPSHYCGLLSASSHHARLHMRQSPRPFVARLARPSQGRAYIADGWPHANGHRYRLATIGTHPSCPANHTCSEILTPVNLTCAMCRPTVPYCTSKGGVKVAFV
jgi:hypothetical protein